MGGSTHKKNISMLTPEQQSLLSGTLTNVGPQAQQTLGDLLAPMSQEDMQALFQQAYVDPAMRTFEQQMIPSIQQKYVDANAGASSALNQALAQSAGDLSTSLGSQYGQLYQNQQQRQQNAVNQFLPLMTGQTFSPVVEQKQGLLGPLIQGGAAIGSAAAMSSKEVKENIREYKKGNEVLGKFNVRQYDYIKEVGGAKDRVGLIAEELPQELTAYKDGILHVDLYGVVSLMINTIQELTKKVEKLEAK